MLRPFFFGQKAVIALLGRTAHNRFISRRNRLGRAKQRSQADDLLWACFGNALHVFKTTSFRRRPPSVRSSVPGVVPILWRLLWTKAPAISGEVRNPAGEVRNRGGNVQSAISAARSPWRLSNADTLQRSDRAGDSTSQDSGRPAGRNGQGIAQPDAPSFDNANVPARVKRQRFRRSRLRGFPCDGGARQV